MIRQLENGLSVLIQENHIAPVVALQMWVNHGSADDPPGLSGLAHVLEHMVFKGTHRRGEGQIAREIEEAGGQINAYTSFDQTVYHVILPSRYFQRGLDILADAMQNARMREEDLRRELQVILEEIKQGEDSPSKVVARELFGTAFRKHPYGRPVIGKVESVSKLTAKQVEGHFLSWYRPENMTLVMVGDVDPAKALERATRLFPVRPGRKLASRKPVAAEPAQKGLRVKVIGRNTQEAYISLAFPIPNLMHPATPALDLAAIILGHGDSSRLVQRIKHEQRLVSDIYAYSYTPRDPGLLIIGATTAPDKAVRAVQAITREVFALAASDVSTEELRRAKTIIESDAVYQKETVQGQARKLGFFQTVAGSVLFEQQYNRRVSEATAAALRKAAAAHFQPQACSISLLTPAAQGQERELTQAIEAAAYEASAAVRAQGDVRISGAEDLAKVTLPNGARLIVLRDTSVPLVAVRAVWNGGLRYESTQQNGVTNLLAGLITRGTATRSAVQINEAVESMAGSIGGFSGHNSFGIRAELLSRHWEQGLEILGDCLLNPSFAPAEVDRERRQVLDDIRAQQDNPSVVAFQLFNRTLFRKHPYRLDPLGTVDSVSRLRREDLIAFYARHFRPSNMVLAVVGDVDPDRVAEKFAQIFGQATKKQGRPPRLVAEPARQVPEEVYQLLDKQQAHLVLGFPGTTVFSKDRYVLEVIAAVLSGQGGRLFAELRDRQSLAYNVGAYSLEGLEPGLFAVYLATSPGNIQQALQGIEQQLARLRDKQVTAKELSRVKRHLVGSYEISLQRKATLAALLAFNECYGLGFKAYQTYAGQIMAVTAEDVLRVARSYFDPQRRAVAIVKPEELSPGAAKQLGAKEAGVVKGDGKAPGDGRQGRRRKAR